MNDTSSLVKTLNDIVEKNINSKKDISSNVVKLYTAGSLLSPTYLGKISS